MKFDETVQMFENKFIDGVDKYQNALKSRIFLYYGDGTGDIGVFRNIDEFKTKLPDDFRGIEEDHQDGLNKLINGDVLEISPRWHGGSHWVCKDLSKLKKFIITLYHVDSDDHFITKETDIRVLTF